MTAPSIVSVGTINAGTGTITPTLNTSGVTNGDVLLLIIETANQHQGFGGGWEVIDFNGVNTAGGTTAAGISVFWTKYDSATYADPVLPNPGIDHLSGLIIAITGADTV